MTSSPEPSQTPAGVAAPRQALADADNPFTQPVAICTLADDALRNTLQGNAALKGVLVGSLHTENLGIEQIITYIVGNPNIRFLILCGVDGQQAIGHLPGQSFLALAQNGLDENGRIIGALGKRPVIKNISREAVEHFRRNVEVIDLIDNSVPEDILLVVSDCIERTPGPAAPFYAEQPIAATPGSAPEHMISDPAGYFVICADHERQRLVMKHYTNQGVLDTVIEGQTGAELYFPAIERELLSRLDHAAYLGRELYRAEQALKLGVEYRQDDV